ncbi:hypothetical protein KEU06_08245 [Pseudaminobacter sp. 19-2017]|uniref:Uncharacterized protein n=1 Tax=Pseudaminobacter soli (ex Zhang et al. 2022) TaxID=2831468 RepID=A0A942I2E2_9HYPH|nr:hypothetical protein [Pseudaminobacter soli]MBS3648618.1 hypothetical protein [Pseudaminobacter soli]
MFRAINTDAATAPGFSWTGDTNTGIWNAAADSIGFSTGGTNRLTLSTTALTSTVGYSGTTGTFSGAVTGASFSGVGTSLTALNATNLTSGTVPSARIAGAYTGFTNITGSGIADFAKFNGNDADSAAAPSFTWTSDPNTGMWAAGADQIGFTTGGVNRMTLSTSTLDLGLRLNLTSTSEAIRLDAPTTGNDPYISFYTAGTRQGYFQSQDGSATSNGLKLVNEQAATNLTLVLRNSGLASDGLGFVVGSTGYDVYHTGNDSGLAKSATSITAGNGLSGGGTLAATRTVTLGTPSSLTHATTNAVTTTSHTHDVTLATAAEIRNNTNAILGVNGVWSAAGIVTIPYAASVAIDFATLINGTMTLTGNCTLANPTGTTNGQSGFIRIIQDATGGRTLSFGTSWKFENGVTPTLTTSASALNFLFYQVYNSTTIYATIARGLA